MFNVHGGDSPFQSIGIPDLLCCFRGIFMGLELKQPGGRVSPLQLKIIDDIREAGGIAEVIYSVSEVEFMICGLTKYDPKDLSYIAGFFDGEGSVYTVTKSNGIRYARIGISQADESILKWIQATLGWGRITLKTTKKPNHKPCWSLTISKVEEVKSFIEVIRPYSRLALRHRQMKIAYPLACSIRHRVSQGETSNVGGV